MFLWWPAILYSVLNSVCLLMANKWMMIMYNCNAQTVERWLQTVRLLTFKWVAEVDSVSIELKNVGRIMFAFSVAAHRERVLRHLRPSTHTHIADSVSCVCSQLHTYCLRGMCHHDHMSDIIIHNQQIDYYSTCTNTISAPRSRPIMTTTINESQSLRINSRNSVVRQIIRRD